MPASLFAPPPFSISLSLPLSLFFYSSAAFTAAESSSLFVSFVSFLAPFFLFRGSSFLFLLLVGYVVLLSEGLGGAGRAGSGLTGGVGAGGRGTVGGRSKLLAR